MISIIMLLSAEARTNRIKGNNKISARIKAGLDFTKQRGYIRILLIHIKNRGRVNNSLCGESVQNM